MSIIDNFLKEQKLDNIIFARIAGSHSHNLNKFTSDLDFSGVSKLESLSQEAATL